MLYLLSRGRVKGLDSVEADNQSRGALLLERIPLFKFGAELNPLWK